MTKSMDDHLLEKIQEVEKVHWWWEGRRKLVKILMGNKSYKKILDVGCGTGETMSFLEKLYPKAKQYGIDTSDRAIKYAKALGHKNIIRASATKLPYKSNTFDAVLFLDVLEHVKADLKAISEAKRVLAQDGIIIITARALPFIWSAYDTKQGHQRRYTRRMLINIANKTGLRVAFISYFNFLLCAPIIIIRVLSNIKLLKNLSSYDNKVNLNIANKRILNSFLRKLFLFEISLLRYIKLPVGISVGVVLQKYK